jgi:hypothetical protein
MAEDSLYGCGPSCSKFGKGLRAKGSHPGIISAFSKGLSDESHLLHVALAEAGVANPVLYGLEKKRKRRTAKKRHPKSSAGVAKKKKKRSKKSS